MRSLSIAAKSASIFSIFAACLLGCGAPGTTKVTGSEYSVRHKAEERGPTHTKQIIEIQLPDAPLPPSPPTPERHAGLTPAPLLTTVAEIVPYFGFGAEACLANTAAKSKVSAPAPGAPTPNGSTVVIDGVSIVAPPGASVRVHTEETFGAESSVDQGADGKGAGMTGSGEDVAGKFRGEAPKTALPGASGGGASGGGGGGAFSASLTATAIKGLNFFHWCGGLTLIAAALVWWFGRPVFNKLAVGLALVGAVSIGVGVAIADYPWVWVALLAAFGGVAAYFVVKARAAQRTDIALKTVVEGVEKANGAGEPVKALIKQTAMEHGVLAEVKATVTKAKAAIGTVVPSGPIANPSNQSK